MNTKKNTSEFVKRFGITKRGAARNLRFESWVTYNPFFRKLLRALASHLEHGGDIR